MAEAARTKNDLADIINVAIEELVHHRYELPLFNTLVRAGKRVRGTMDRAFYRQVRQHLDRESCQNLDSLMKELEPNKRYTLAVKALLYLLWFICWESS